MISGGGADISDSYDISLEGIVDDQDSNKGQQRGSMSNNNKQLSNSYKPTKRHDKS